jgi:hypothetical protein
MPYEPVAHGKLDGLDYRAPRPFMNWQRPDLLEKIEEWIALNPPRLELATLAYEELKSRGENRARAALQLFPTHLPPRTLGKTSSLESQRRQISPIRSSVLTFGTRDLPTDGLHQQETV